MPKKKGQNKAKNSPLLFHIKEQQLENYNMLEDDTDVKKCKGKIRSQKAADDVTNSSEVVYPEIVWYLISPFIQPEDILAFAMINRATYSITKRESFWFLIYKRYCEKDKRLPERLRIEDNYRAYGLRQRVIRALYHTYDLFVNKLLEFEHKMSPHSLLKRRCVNTWYCKGLSNWKVYLKFKRQREMDSKIIYKDEGRVDANPEEDTKVLEIYCKHVYNIPPLMGMTLSRFSLSYLSPGLKLEMAFSSSHDASSKLQSLQSVVLDSVVKWYVYDWWHPRYPHFEVKPPPLMKDEESPPLLDVDFFDMSDEDY